MGRLEILVLHCYVSKWNDQANGKSGNGDTTKYHQKPFLPLFGIPVDPVIQYSRQHSLSFNDRISDTFCQPVACLAGLLLFVVDHRY